MALRLYFLRKAVAATVVLVGALDAIDPGKLLVCLSVGTESLAAALDTRCCPLVPGSKSGHACTLCERPFMLSLRDYTDNYL